MLTPKELTDVCTAYRLGEALECEPLGGTRNRNYRLKTTLGSYAVRDRYVGYRDKARIVFDHQAMDFLHERDVSVARPLRNSHGATFTQSGDHLWEVFPFIQGRHFGDGRIDDVRALAEALASFHQAGWDFNVQKIVHKLGPRGETDPSELLEIIRQLKPDAASAIELYGKWLVSAASELPDSIFASLPHTLIHGDIQPANILIDAGPVTALVDLDWCDWRPRIYDLAFAILLCCSTHTTPIDGGDIWSLSQAPVIKHDVVEVFLETYDGQGFPLSSAERQALHPQIILSWCHCRLAGALKVEPARRSEFLDRPPRDLGALFPGGII